jgi:ABC-type multidrug transport system ATPase subunit
MLLDDVWFRYGRRGDWTLRGVQATARPGDTIVVLGRNGAGKSTLLQLAAGVLRPVKGEVRDRPAVIGWVPERFPADQPFTAEQYLIHVAALRGLREAAAVAVIENWSERLGLTQHLDTRLAELSKGTAQKVGLAQALLVPPELLVLDEPWEGLDAVARTMIPSIVSEVTSTGGTVLVSDHRGEIAGLRDPIRWAVRDAGVVADAAPEPVVIPDRDTQDMVVEVSVRRADADATVARLRADGHHVLAVRPADTEEVRR